MTRFTLQQAAAGFELEQLLMEYCEVLDLKGGPSALHLFSEDIDFDMGKMRYRGHQEMLSVYAANMARFKGVPRTNRHVATNVRIKFDGDERATIKTTFLLFSGDGSPPLADATVPTIVSDARLECRIEADGEWRIYGFYGAVIFVGDDPVVKQNLLG